VYVGGGAQRRQIEIHLAIDSGAGTWYVHTLAAVIPKTTAVDIKSIKDICLGSIEARDDLHFSKVTTGVESDSVRRFDVHDVLRACSFDLKQDF